MNIILCGYHWTGCEALGLLIAQGHNVFVYTHKNPSHVPSLEKYCQKININYSLDNISKAELPFKPDVICSIYYRYIIKKHIINACNGKIFNLHPSLLPKYRGCSSLTWAMINGDKEVGFTYHYIDENCDTGNIILQESCTVKDWDTQETLYTRLMFESMKYFEQVLDLVQQGFNGQIQEEQKSSYYPRGCPYNGEINPEWDNDFKERFIRAMIYPPYPVAKFNGQDIFDVKQLDNNI
ncbi:MAG: formyltransferase family protein [Dolichospermum sp.]